MKIASFIPSHAEGTAVIVNASLESILSIPHVISTISSILSEFIEDIFVTPIPLSISEYHIAFIATSSTQSTVSLDVMKTKLEQMINNFKTNGTVVKDSHVTLAVIDGKLCFEIL